MTGDISIRQTQRNQLDQRTQKENNEENPMPQVTVEGEKPLGGEAGKNLVLPLEDNGIDELPRGGGEARAASCRAEIVSGEVPPLSEEEREPLEEPKLIAKYRLSC